MNTLDFLRATLPEEGTHYLVLMRAGKNGMPHFPYSSLEAMVAAIAKADADPTLTVYHATSSYHEPFVMNGEKKQYRVPQNCAMAKAFWIDLDVGIKKDAEGKGYATKQLAVTALRQFCKTTNFPAPMLVSSGNGIHAYWPLTVAIDRDSWVAMATQFKSILKHFGVLADPTRTADFASILRPVGSHNKKNPDNHKAVKVLSTVESYRPEQIMAALSNIVSNFDVECELVIPRRLPTDSDLNDDLTAHLSPQFPLSADLVAERCAQVRHVKETGGVSGYEQWRGVIGIIKFCENPDEIAHAWGGQASGYSEAETQKKLDTWNSGPSTCDYFLKGEAKALCEGCTSKGRFKSPVNLGRVEIEPEAEKLVPVTIDGRKTTVEIPAFLRGYRFATAAGSLYDCMIRDMKDKDGNLEAHPFASTLFYPITRIQQSNGISMVRIRRHLPNGEVREFNIESTTIAVGGSILLSSLGGNEIMPTHNKDAPTHITAYLRDGVNDLLRKNSEVNTFTSFGWNKDKSGFLIGTTLYKKDGTTRDVLLGGMAASESTPFVREGASAGWTLGVNTLYAHKGAEVYQYTLAAGFGAIIACFGQGDYRGIILALTGSKTGRGKTTVCRAALYAFGTAGEMTASGPKGSTVNARGGRLGAYKNLPALFDEVTKMRATDLSEMAYEISSGVGKARMVAAGGGNVTAAEQHTWCTHTFVTANSDIGMTLATGQANSHAEAVRTLEIKMDDYHVPMMSLGEAEIAVANIERNVGSAGAEFIAYVVQNQDLVSERVVHFAAQIAKGSSISQESAFRFYRNHAAVTLAAASIMVDLGLVNIVVNDLTAWIIGHLNVVCKESIEQNTVSGEDALATMINDMTGAIITTIECRDGRVGTNTSPEVVHMTKELPIGRAIIGNDRGTEPLGGRLYLVKTAVRDWCLKNRIDMKTIVDHATVAGLFVPAVTDKFVIGKGTTITTAQARCFVFDLNKLNGIAAIPKLTVVPMPQGVAA